MVVAIAIRNIFQPYKISEHLTGYSSETCNTYNMLKVTSFFHLDADKKYANSMNRLYTITSSLRKIIQVAEFNSNASDAAPVLEAKAK